ncbi:MAG TPA: ABC transporter ATP-binding protein [Candidatus Pelagibacter bacterium]|jgi:ABC-type lipoprotein export system ATPase subunit|nr:ABC transporter ATP-binding protein [Pelagibacteraceae bacterium]HJN84471.1 ABC transporter ATP-binding protein [Candidatus Pelagibacter bacterium]|tara:strand:- start:3458 stop:4141 length:684 start_codon:yes stop_codon:yes gene_type:complete
MNSLIELKNISKHYIVNKKTTILRRVNFKFKKGLIYSLVGPSGSGKSTLLNILSLIDKPSSGEIVINNNPIKYNDISKNDQLRGDKIGIIYQQNNLLPDFNALENVYLARLAIDNNKDKAIFEAKKIIKNLGLSNRLNHFPSELSGGELQRIAISRALINKPEIILADEPTGSLDHSTAKEVFKTLYKLKSKKRLIIYATHNRLFANMADCKLEMIDGNIRPSNARK